MFVFFGVRADKLCFYGSSDVGRTHSDCPRHNKSILPALCEVADVYHTDGLNRGLPSWVAPFFCTEVHLEVFTAVINWWN